MKIKLLLYYIIIILYYILYYKLYYIGFNSNVMLMLVKLLV